jgi:hypothetical protein
MIQEKDGAIKQQNKLGSLFVEIRCGLGMEDYHASRFIKQTEIFDVTIPDSKFSRF